MPGLPPWIQPADEAGQTAAGFQIGMHLGAQQAAQQNAAQSMALEKEKQAFIEQAGLRQMQLKAIEDAREQAKFGLQAAAAARKSDALLGYQKAVAEGMDPMKAMLQFGPGMGQPVTAVAAAARALAPKAQMTPTLLDLGSGVKGVQAGNQFHLLPQPKEHAQWHTEERQSEDGSTFQVQVNDLTGEEKAAPRAPKPPGLTEEQRLRLSDHYDVELMNLEKANAGMDLSEDAKPPDPKKFPAIAARWKAAKVQADAIRAKKQALDQPEKASKPAAKSKVERAKELSRANPTWNKQQVIDAVNQEFAHASPASP